MATIIIGDIITVVSMAVEQTSTQGRKEPWHYQGMITGRSWPVASRLTGRRVSAVDVDVLAFGGRASTGGRS